MALFDIIRKDMITDMETIKVYKHLFSTDRLLSCCSMCILYFIAMEMKI